MNTKTSTAGGGWSVLGALGLTCLLLTASAGADAPASAAPEEFVGAWSIQVTLRDCASGAPLGPPFNSLVSAHQGGTLSENPGSLAFAVGQRTAGHGTWTRKGRRTYQQDFLALILFDTAPNLPGTPTFDPSLPISPGFFAGWQAVSHKVRLTGPDSLTSSGTNAFYKSDGTVYRSGCSTAMGQRLK